MAKFAVVRVSGAVGAVPRWLVLVIAFLCLGLSAPVEAKKKPTDYAVWYAPELLPSHDEAALTIVNLHQFFKDRMLRPVEKFAVTRDGIGVSSSKTTIQTDEQKVASTGGAWFGSSYVPYFGTSTVVTQTPVTSTGQGWLDFKELTRIEIRHSTQKYYPQWMVRFINAREKTQIDLYTVDRHLAVQLANAVATLASAKQTDFLGMDLFGWKGWFGKPKDYARAKWKQGNGWIVTEVLPGSPAEAAGLRGNDILLEIAGKPVQAGANLPFEGIVPLWEKGPDATFDIVVARAGQQMTLRMTARHPLHDYYTKYAVRQPQPPPKLGVRIRDLNAADLGATGVLDMRGAFVAEVLPGSLAERMTIAPGDILLELNGKSFDTSAQFIERVRAEEIVSVKVWRKGQAVVLSASASPKRFGVALRDPVAGADDALLPSGATGVVVVRVEPNSPAALMGLRENDVILEVNRAPISGMADFGRLVAGGEVTTLKVYRQGKPLLLGGVSEF